MKRALVIGGGISGLAAAVELAGSDGSSPYDVIEVWEAAERVGGKIATSPFATLPHVDEGADAFLRRVPAGLEFVGRVGVAADDLIAPEPVGAAVYHGELHDIPAGILLGVPAAVRPFIGSKLLSWRGKARAAIEPLLPATDPDDSIGKLVRRRFGNEVHDRLVDALVGSIYATDTDRASLRAVPQLDQLASAHRSLLLGARATRRRQTAPTNDSSRPEPIFAGHRAGTGAIVDAAASFLAEQGVEIRTGRAVGKIERDGDGWRVDDERFDAIVVATPAAVAADLLRSIAPQAAAGLGTIEAADVVMVRLAVPAATWPDRLSGRSGYLVAKTQQRNVTAVSFGSQKWAHWRPTSGDQILRVSLGRDGLPTAHLDDDEVVQATVDELGLHLGLAIEPTHVSITRWTGAFPQYRPHHHSLVNTIDAHVPPGIGLAGASYRGIGIPACIADGQRTARRLLERSVA